MKNAFFEATLYKIYPYSLLTDMHVPTLARMTYVLRLLVLDLCEPLPILFVLFTLHCFATAHYFAEQIQVAPTNFISVKPMVPKHIRDVTLMKIVIMSYYP